MRLVLIPFSKTSFPPFSEGRGGVVDDHFSANYVRDYSVNWFFHQQWHWVIQFNKANEWSLDPTTLGPPLLIFTEIDSWTPTQTNCFKSTWRLAQKYAFESS